MRKETQSPCVDTKNRNIAVANNAYCIEQSTITSNADKRMRTCDASVITVNLDAFGHFQLGRKQTEEFFINKKRHIVLRKIIHQPLNGRHKLIIKIFSVDGDFH